MSDQLEWLRERAQDTAVRHGMPYILAFSVEWDRAVMRFGLPLPEEDPYERAQREREQQRIERVERTLSPVYQERVRTPDAEPDPAETVRDMADE